MYNEALLTSLVLDLDPAPAIIEHLLTQLGPQVKLDDLGSTYNEVEERLRDFEEWLHLAWGRGFYDTLVTDAEGWSLTKTFRIAAERNGNVLVCDGFSIRELIVLRHHFKKRLSYTIGRAPAPTTTENAARSFFQTTNLKEAFSTDRLIEGKMWRGETIKDLNKPPRLGSERGHMLLTQFPDSPLTYAVAHRTTQMQDLSNIIDQIIKLVESLSMNSPLTITGDHGYIYLGPNPQKNLWDPYTKAERVGGNYGDKGMRVNNTNVAIGRFHANPTSGSNTFITHGGVSLTESLVPVVTIEAGA